MFPLPKKKTCLRNHILRVFVLAAGSFSFFLFLSPAKVSAVTNYIWGTDGTNFFIKPVGGSNIFQMSSTGYISIATMNASNLSSGTFGSNTGGGNYSFSGNVGIGTASPATKLDVNGTHTLRDGTGNVLHQSGVFGTSNECGTENGHWVKLGQFNNNGAWTSAGLDFDIWSNGAYITNRQHLNVNARNSSTGIEQVNVGITSLEGPSTSHRFIQDAKVVYVSGSGVTNNQMAVWVQFANSWVCSFSAEARYYGTWTAGPYLTNQPSGASITDAGTQYGQNEYNFDNNIAIAGSVGIGTISPTGPFQIVSSTLPQFQLTNSGTLQMEYNGGISSIDSYSNAGGAATIALNSLSGGNVGIGTASPGYKLDVAGAVRSSSGGFVFPDGTTQASAATGIPSGMVAFFNLSSCPSGWTDLTASYGGRYVVANPSGGTLAATVGTALSNTENRPTGQHTHSINDPGHSHLWYAGSGSGSSGCGGHPIYNYNYSCVGWQSGYIAGATTGITINNAGSVAGTNAPYVQLLACQKN
ncbi:hypothetical protein M1271_07135 [Patescibacteria group bacterium]|nr:hypothetical protein [Patescibacteria group bacterium]